MDGLYIHELFREFKAIDGSIVTNKRFMCYMRQLYERECKLDEEYGLEARPLRERVMLIDLASGKTLKEYPWERIAREKECVRNDMITLFNNRGSGNEKKYEPK
jgi:hypothetical protein